MADDRWTDNEIEAAVLTYLDMLELDQARRTYSKTEYRNKLLEGALSSRNKSAYEFRMQNISAVIESEFGLDWLQGYRPAKNVGAGPTKQILKVLEKHLGLPAKLYQPTTSAGKLDTETEEASQRLKSAKRKPRPKGNQIPNSATVTAVVYSRDPLVKAWVLDAAKGYCESCGCEAPFLTAKREPFLEVHHVVTLADGGPDTVENAVALCPNCHRRAHYCADRSAWIKEIYGRVSRLDKAG